MLLSSDTLWVHNIFLYDILKKSYRNKVLPNVLLFYGSPYIGKKDFVQGLSKDIFSPQCVEEELRLDAKSNKEDFRKKISAFIRFDASADKVKICIINNIHEMPFVTSSILLKALEYNYSNTFFFIISSKKHTLQDTILSRCLQINCNDLLNNYANKYLTANNNTLNNIYAKIFQHCPRTIKEIFDQKLQYHLEKIIEYIAIYLLYGDIAKIVEYIEIDLTFVVNSNFLFNVLDTVILRIFFLTRDKKEKIEKDIWQRYFYLHLFFLKSGQEDFFQKIQNAHTLIRNGIQYNINRSFLLLALAQALKSNNQKSTRE